MILSILIAGLALGGVVATVLTARRDGYRRVPTDPTRIPERTRIPEPARIADSPASARNTTAPRVPQRRVADGSPSAASSSAVA